MTRPYYIALFNTGLHHCLLSVFVCLLGASHVYAGAIEEVVVTAQKREQSLQDVGITITAFTTEDVRNRGLTNIDRLAAAVPNLQALDDAAGLPSFRIRGVGLNEFQAGFDSPVGVHLDEVFYSKPFLASMGFFDVQRIEALKGPQGTVFGRNTTGGAVNYYSNQPTEEFSAGLKLSYGRYERFNGEGHISGALSDNLLGRLAVQVVNHSSGPYRNLFDGNKLGDAEQYRVRGILNWSNELTEVRVTAHYGSREADLTPYDNLFQSTPGGLPNVAAVIREPLSRFVVNQDYFPTTDSEAAGVNVKIEHDLGFATLTSITSYESFERDNREDSDNTTIRSTNIDWFSDIEQLTQELRLAGEHDRWNYLFGLYYEDDKLVQADFIDVNDISALLGGIGFLGSDFQQDTKSYAVFTSHEYAMTDRLSLIFGARYTVEENRISGVAGAAPPSAVGPAPANRVPVAGFVADAERTDNSFNFKAGLNYQPTDEMLLYFSASTGFRSGGYDFGLGSPLETFDPEDTTSFELGMKTSLLDGSMNVNAAAFYTEVDDYQTNVNIGAELIPRRRNIGQLQTWGLEGDMLWQPNRQWRVQLAAGYTNAEVAKINNDPNGIPFAVDGTPILGNEPVNTPEFSFNATVDYIHPLNNNLQLEFMASWTWVDERFLEIQNAADHLVSSYDTLDLSLALAPEDGNWRIRAWGRNVTDEDYLRYINDVPAFALFLTINNDPATYGVDLEYSF